MNARILRFLTRALRFDFLAIAAITFAPFPFAAIADDGAPYGQFAEPEYEAICAFAKTKGCDIERQFVLARDNRDAEALGLIFDLSTEFSTLDDNARHYGNLIFSCLLNFGERWGTDKLAAVVVSRTPAVQQRIRDFMFYPTTLVPDDKRIKIAADNRRDYPLLFPKTYEFGKNNPIFVSKNSSNASYSK